MLHVPSANQRRRREHAGAWICDARGIGKRNLGMGEVPAVREEPSGEGIIVGVLTVFG
jgi:hypothetical protein